MGNPGQPWGTTDFLLAHISDLENRAYALAYAVATDGKKADITPVPRPGMKKNKATFLRLVDEETDEEIESGRGQSALANQLATDLLARLKPGGSGLHGQTSGDTRRMDSSDLSKPPEVTGPPGKE
jgi:hypothetical protein